MLNQKQSIAKVKKIDDLNTEVKIYDFNGSGFQNTITKSINLDQIVTKSNVELFQTGATYSIMCANYWQNNYGASISVKYNEGDFNGDGISEILIQVPPKEFKATIGGVYVNDYENINYNECPLNISTTDDPDFYILDLNPNQSTTLGTIGYHAVIGTDIDINAKKYIADFMEMENQIFYK